MSAEERATSGWLHSPLLANGLCNSSQQIGEWMATQPPLLANGLCNSSQQIGEWMATQPPAG